MHSRAKHPSLIIAICSAIYFISYFARVNYAAIVVAIVCDFGVHVSAAGLVATASFFSYGIGQLVSGYLGDRISPKLLLVVGLIGTMFCNLGMAYSQSIEQMTILWLINGGFQALLWPPLVRLMVENLDTDEYRRGSMLVNLAASFSTVLVYICGAWLLPRSGWRSMFLLSVLLCLLMLIIWAIVSRHILVGESSEGQISVDDGKKKGSVLDALRASALLPVLISIVLLGLLRDGITTWMPSFITDNFGFAEENAVLLAAVLPVFAMISVLVSKRLYYYVADEVTLSLILFGFASLANIFLIVILPHSAVGSALCMALITASMHGINLMLISYLPSRFLATGYVSTISGILNACTYLGSALSAYGIAWISERLGWYGTVLAWLVACVMGAALCGYYRYVLYRKRI